MFYLIIKTSYQRDTYDFSCFHNYINWDVHATLPGAGVYNVYQI